MKYNKRKQIIATILSLNIVLSNIINISAAPIDNVGSIEKYSKMYEEDVKYPYAEFYLTHEELQNIIKDANIHYYNAEYVLDNEDDILKQIKENSKVVNINVYNSVFTSEDNELFESLLKKIIKGILEKNTNDKNEDLKKIKELKILYSNVTQEALFGDPYTFGCYYSQNNNAIVINKDMVMIQKENSNESYEEIIEKYLYHSINHVRQVPIEPNTSNKMDYLKRYHSIITEAAASKEPVVLNKTDKKAEAYFLDRYDSAILLLSLLNKEANPEKYYNAIFDEDTVKLFEIFNLNDYKSIANFFNILYSIDALCKNNFFSDYYKELNQEDNFALMQEEIGNNYALDIYNNYTKKLIVSANEIPLKENITMYYIGLNTLATSMNLDKKMDTKNDNYVMSSLYFGHLNYLNFIKEHYKVEDEVLNSFIDNEIPYILENIMSNLTNNIKENDVYDEFTSKIIEKYPMIKCIIVKDINKLNYQKLFNNYDEKLMKLN